MPAPQTDGPLNIRRKRLLFRSWHRGTREADLILGSFAESYLAQFADPQLDWINGRTPPPPEHDTDVTRLLLAFRYRPRPT
jgi:antitoxin CptB